MMIERLVNKMATKVASATSEEAREARATEQTAKPKKRKKHVFRKLVLGVVALVLVVNVYSAVNRKIENRIKQATTIANAVTTEDQISAALDAAAESSNDYTYTDADGNVVEVPAYAVQEAIEASEGSDGSVLTDGFNLSMVPEYTGDYIVEVNGGMTYFTSQEKKYSAPFITFSDGQLFALIGRESVSSDYNNMYELYPDGFEYLPGMQAIEEAIYACVTENPNVRVLYRCTPYYQYDDTICKGMLVEAFSVEDEGATVNICVWCYNEDNL